MREISEAVSLWRIYLPSNYRCPCKSAFNAVKNIVKDVAGPLNGNPNSLSSCLIVMISIFTPASLRTLRILLEGRISRRFDFSFKADELIY